MSDSVPVVVITGIGATTPLGGDAPTTWNALTSGVSGARLLPYEWVERFELPVKIGATLAVEPDQVLTRQEIKRNDRSSQMSLIAAREAWADASRTAEIDVDHERLGVVVASGIGGVTTLLDAYDTLLAKGARRVLPLTVPMLMPNGPAATVGIEFRAQAGVHTTVSACASGAEAIASGVEMIRSGRADVVIAGGTEASIHPLPVSGFAAMRAMSTRNDEPERASRPYDKGRDGFVLGEGAGIVVLESEAHARARGADVYAVVAGVGMTSDGYHITAPEPEGRHVSRAIAMALADADLTPSDIVHINAHATSTPVGDIAEINAIQAALGSAASGVAVSATKSMTGHTLGAAGAIETIAAVLALKHRSAPPTINLDDPDDELTLDVVRVDPRPLPAGDIAALNNSFGFGGHNVVLVLRSA